MRLAIFGGTGGTGRELVSQALTRGHELTVLARDASQATLPREVRIVQGDARNAQDVEAVIAGSEAVISTLGASLPRSYDSANDIGSQAVPLILSSMEKSGVRRLIVVSAFGAGESLEQISPAFRVVMATALSGIYRDKNAMEPLVTRSSVDWTIVRPTNLRNGAPRHPAQVETKKVGVSSWTSRSSVAKFLLDQLETDAHVRQAVVITEAG